jgi:hypothetical protein
MDKIIGHKRLRRLKRLYNLGRLMEGNSKSFD